MQDDRNIEEITAEEIVEQYQEEQPEAQDEGENLVTLEDNAGEEA